MPLKFSRASSYQEESSIKKKIVGSLLFLFLLVAIGSSAATWYMSNTVEELGHMLELHEVQGLRHELVIDALEVQTDLHTARTPLASDRGLIFSNLEKLKEASNECLSCHHPPELEEKLNGINSLVAEYESALEDYLKASDEDPHIKTLGTYPAAILEKIFLQSDEMAQKANIHLEEISKAATKRMKNARLILLATLSLVLFLGLIIAQRLVQMLTYPIEKLVEATEIIAAGGIGHQIEHPGEAEFGQLTQHFNVMSRSLEGNIEALRLKNEDLQQAITKCKQAEQEKEILQQQLLFTQKMEAVSTLSAGVAHEFNNIFHVILIAVERMANKPCEVAANERGIALINNVTQRGVDITKRLLTFCEEVEYLPIRIDLNDRVQRFVTILEENFPESISIQLSLAEDLPPVIADPGCLEIILLNLSQNAKDSMPGGGVLSIDTSFLAEAPGDPLAEGQSGWVLLKVSDTGGGMTDHTVQHIFDPFFTTKDVGVGTGLGLATAYGIVKKCGGQINCTSEWGEGTLFEIRLPAQQE